MSVWVGGTWPGRKPFVRAARRNGVVPMRLDGQWQIVDTATVAERMPSLRPATSRARRSLRRAEPRSPAQTATGPPSRPARRTPSARTAA
jgi:hypothetical protein